MRLTADNRDGVHSWNIEVPDADENVAMDWLSKLDGKQHTLLSLEREDGWQLMVGGGPLCYVVTLGDGDQNLTFQNASGDQSMMVELCAGGQYGEFPETFCANREQATNVTSLFFRGQEKQEQWA
jgi:hypothetical protein